MIFFFFLVTKLENNTNYKSLRNTSLIIYIFFISILHLNYSVIRREFFFDGSNYDSLDKSRENMFSCSKKILYCEKL